MKPTRFGPGGIPLAVLRSIATGLGISVSGTPSPGDVVIADGPTTGHWGPPSSAGSGAFGALLIADDHGTPITFDDILLTEDGSDFLYAD